MSLAITHSFVAHTDILSSQMNQNFQDIQTFINNSPIGGTGYQLPMMYEGVTSSVVKFAGGSASVNVNGGSGLYSSAAIPFGITFATNVRVFVTLSNVDTAKIDNLSGPFLTSVTSTSFIARFNVGTYTSANVVSILWFAIGT